MSGKYHKLQVNIFSLHDQDAEVRPDLTPPDLIEAILKEFRGLDQLGDDPARYQLVGLGDRVALDDDQKLVPQLGDRPHLELIDRPPELPKGAEALAGRIYLRDQERNKVFRLHWQPAVIGRRQRAQAEEQPLAVNLADHPASDYISKRHAQITKQGGRLLIESLTSKPTHVITASGDPVPLVEGKPYPLAHGDVIHLVNSRVQLRVLIDE